MKKLILVILLTFTLGGCSQKPDSVVKDFFDAFKSYDIENISKFDNSSDCFIGESSFSEGLFDLNKSLDSVIVNEFTSLLTDFDYEIIKTELIDDSAIVQVQLTTYSLANLYEGIFISTMQDILAYYPSGDFTENEMNVIYSDNFLSISEEAIKDQVNMIYINLIKDENSWKIDRENNSEFFNFLFGGLVHMKEPTFLKNISQVEAGDGSSFIIADGSLWAWGLNDYGQLGDGTKLPRSYPIHIMDNVVSVSSGGRYTVALKDDGSLWAWGWNCFGELGNGKSSCDSELLPIYVMDDVKTFSTGYENVYVIKNDDSLWAWGRNIDGTMLDGSVGDNAQLSPIHIMDDVKSVSSGSRHMVVLKNNDTVWTWGVNWQGQLCNGTTTDSYIPYNIANDVVNAYAGQNLTTFYIKSDGSLWACGYNENGQLGDGTTSNRLSPVKILNNVIKVSAGSISTLAIKEDGSLWFWGLDDFNQIDNREYPRKLIPIQVLTNVTNISTHVHSLVVTGDDNLWSWGRNNFSQLGDGTLEDSKNPINISEYYSGEFTRLLDSYYLLNS